LKTPFDDQQYCSVLSAQAQESLTASAPHARTYLLLEYIDAWGKRALEESQLPEDFKQALQSRLNGLPDARLLLVRGRLPAYGSGPRFFLARTSDPDPALYAFQLDDYRDLLRIDLQAVLEGNPAFASNLHQQPLILVCANGRRDPCCSKFGLPIFRELEALERVDAWQCSHIGGHRFAPNLLILPHGLLYARLGTQSAREVIEAYQRGEVVPSNLRGRTAYPQPVQAGEYFLRQHTGDLHLAAYCLNAIKEMPSDGWEVQFHTPKTKTLYRLSLAARQLDSAVFESCQSDKQTPIKQFELTAPIQEEACPD
jgi:hypothetical protein